MSNTRFDKTAEGGGTKDTRQRNCFDSSLQNGISNVHHRQCAGKPIEWKTSKDGKDSTKGSPKKNKSDVPRGAALRYGPNSRPAPPETPRGGGPL